jgi:hypothetical protein
MSDSPEKKPTHNYNLILIGLGGVSVSVAIIICNIIWWNKAIISEIGYILFILFALMSIWGVAKNSEVNSEINSENKQKNYWTQVKGLQEDKDALELIKVNLANINEYYIWSQKQAKSAFNTAIVTCSVGFLLVAVAVLIPIVKQDFNSTISFISFLGGAITELIGGTIFFVYRKSLAQLNYYHKALHEDQRFLSSVNLIKKFHDKNMGDEMLKEIIQSAIDINRAEFGHSEEKKADKNKSDTNKSDT